MSLAKFQKRIAVNGLYGAIKISLSKTGIKHRRKTIFSLKNAEDRFTKIYNTNHWKTSKHEVVKGRRLKIPEVFGQHYQNSLKNMKSKQFWTHHAVILIGCGLLSKTHQYPTLVVTSSAH